MSVVLAVGALYRLLARPKGRDSHSIKGHQRLSSRRTTLTREAFRRRGGISKRALTCSRQWRTPRRRLPVSRLVVLFFVGQTADLSQHQLGTWHGKEIRRFYPRLSSFYISAHNMQIRAP